MINILFITTDLRAIKLIESFQPLVKAKLGSVGDFDMGLKGVFDKRPAEVYIQNEISGVSGEAVARHIKGLLRDESPKIILLLDGPPKRSLEKELYDDGIDLSLPGQELISIFRARLEKIPGLQWKETAPNAVAPQPRPKSPAVSATSQVKTDNTDVKTPEMPPPAQIEEMETQSPAAEPKIHGKDVSPSRSTAAKTQQVMTDDGNISADTVARKSPSVVTLPVVEPAEESDVHDSLPPFESIFTGRPPQRRKPWLYIFPIAVLIALGVGFYVVTCNSGSSQVPAKVASQAKTQPLPNTSPVAVKTAPFDKLPASVPINGKDLDYAKTHPGWERYQGSGLEFLVFRADSRIKAVQVLSQRTGAISRGYIESMVNEVCGSEIYQVTSREEKGGYMIERGKLSCGGEIAIYVKNKVDIRGFVMTSP